MKTSILSISLGIISLSFGLLKFITPFRDWYLSQIAASGLPEYSYFLGIAGEIIAGLSFLLPFLLSMNNRPKYFFLILANCITIAIMVTATIVHLLPQVPADVLPLKLKPPIIPFMVMTAAIINLVIVQRSVKYKSIF